MDLSNLNNKKEENSQNSEDDESVENVYLEDNLDESRDVVLEKVVAESLEKDKLNYNDYEFIEVHYLHPKYLQFFENLADSIDVLVDFDYCLNLTTIFIFYASLLESRFVLRKEEKEQTERIISKLKTKLHSNNRVDFDDNNLIQMTSETYEFSVIDMPSTYNNLTILSQAIINYYVGERDYEFFESIDSLLFKKDSDESFNALTTVEFLLKTFEDDELNDFTKCLKHLVKDKGSVNFYRELKDTYIKVTKNPTYEFLFGRDDGRDEYE